MSKLKQYIFGGIISAITLVTYIVATLPDGLLHVHFLDIGQGDSILIRSPQGESILVDGGPGTKVIEELSEVLPFYEREIDLVILTHPHQDHVEGLIQVLKFYKVKKVLLTGINIKSPFYEAFLNQINQQKIQIQFATADDDFNIDGLNFDIIYPFHSLVGTTPSSPNNTSITFKLTYNQQSILFTGDIEAEIEESLINSSQNLHSSILKVPHHGSKTSSTKTFLEAVSPQYAIIQAGQKNRHGHPTPQTLDHLQEAHVQKIYRNDLDGRVEVTTDGTTLKFNTEKDSILSLFE